MDTGEFTVLKVIERRAPERRADDHHALTTAITWVIVLAVGIVLGKFVF